MSPADTHIFADFDRVTLARGRSYAQQGAVVDIEDGNRGITASVRGSRRSPYRVYIPLDRKTGLLDPSSAYCTCPVGVMCKHIAAAAIVSLDSGELEEYGEPWEEVTQGAGARGPRAPGEPPRLIKPASRQSVLEALGSVMGSSPGKADQVLPIDGAPTPRGGSAVSEILDSRPVRRQAPSDHWRLVFTISDRPRAGYRFVSVSANPSTGPHACIAPALQYIRKDGVFGRVERYREDLQREPADPGSETLLEKLALDGGEAPLLLHWDSILGNPTLPLYPAGLDGRGRYGQPLRVARIVRIRISFRFDPEETYDTEDVSVLPVIGVELEDAAPAGQQPAAAPGPQEVAWVDAWKDKLIALAGQWLGWCEGEERLLALVRYLVRSGMPLNRGRLAELKRRVEAEKSSLIVVDFPYRSMRLAMRRPQPDLLLRDLADGMSAELTFNYPTRGEIPEAASDEWVLLRRDRGFEERVRNVLQELFLRGHKRVRLDYTPWNDFSAWSFRAHLPNFLEAFGADLLSRGIGLCIGDTSHRLSRTGERLQVRVSSGIDWFDLAVSAGEELDLSRIDLNDPLFSHGFVISGSRFIYIGAEDAEKLRQVIGLLDPSQKSPRVSRRNLEGAAVLSGLVSEPPLELARAAEISRALAAPSGFSDVAPPSGFHGELRDYQRIGYGWLSFLAEQGLNGCLADDMGLGKTVQALALLQSLQEKTTGPSLVVAPVSTLRNWQSEAGRFTPTLNVRVHHGNDRPRDARAFQGVDLVIVSYATLRVDQEIFQKREWNVLILDEAQSIKNPGTRSFAVVKTLKSRHRFTLTGTPIENSVIDLWAQFDFLEPGLLGSARRFRRLLGPRAGDSTDAAHKRLRRIVRPFILRRTKEVVEKSLPPKEEVRLFAEMGARQKAAYNALKEGYRKRIAAALKEKGIAGSGALIFEGLLRLRQAAGIPEHANASLKGTPSAKLALLEEVLEEIVAEGHRVLVFSQFVQTLSVIARALDQRKIPYAYLDGSTRDRQRVIDRFQADPGIPLFLLSLKAGGLGINLTAADYVVIFDPWWNPAAERQAVDRSHRIGQQKPVFVYRLITKESIEERILTLQEQKRTLAAELIEENPKSLLSLGEEELIGLFR